MKKFFQVLGAIAAVALIYLSIGCPLRFFLGICCPGCGMTRGVLAALHGDFAEAMHFHPLLPLLPVAMTLAVFRQKIPKKVFNGVLIAFALAALAVYVFRLCTPSFADVVYIDFSRSFVYQLIKTLKEGL